MKRTKLLTSFAALALILGLGACEENIDVGGVDINDDESTGETSSEEETTTESTTEGNTTETTTEDNTSENTSDDTTEDGDGDDTETGATDTTDEDEYDSYPAIYKKDERYHIYEDGTIEVHQVVAQGEEDSGKGYCTVCGAEDLVTSYVYYTLNSDGTSYYVSKYDTGVWGAIEEVYVKKEYSGLPVTGISYEGASDSTGFSGGTNYNALKFIGLPSSITCIGDYAFKNCTSLEVLDIPEGVTYIGKSAFRNCQALEGPIAIPEGQDTIYSYTFEHCHSLTEVVIPSGVTTLNGDCIFEYCYALTSIILPDSITTLSGSGTDQFAGCTSLEFFKFSNAMTNTTGRFLSGCTALTTVVIPSGTMTIHSTCFNNDTALTTVYYGGSQEQWATASSGNSILEAITPIYITYEA